MLIRIDCYVETPDFRSAKVVTTHCTRERSGTADSFTGLHTKSKLKHGLVVSGLLVMTLARIGLSGQPEVEGRCHHVGEVKDEG